MMSRVDSQLMLTFSYRKVPQNMVIFFYGLVRSLLLARTASLILVVSFIYPPPLIAVFLMSIFATTLSQAFVD